MTLIDQFRHKTIEQRQQKRGDMSSVHICICHNNNLVIPQLRDIEIISIPFGETTAKSINHRLDLRICQDLIDRGLFHIQNFAPYGQNRLVIPITGCLRGPTSRISLHNEDFTDRRVFLLAVGQLSIGVKGILLFGQQIRLCSLFGLSNLRGLLRTGENCF